MASLFRYDQQAKVGSSRKIQHGRRRLPPFSPYSRPPEPTALAPLLLPAVDPPAGERSSWLRGLISGAGKIISSVLGSDSGDSSSSSFSGYSSDEDYDPIPNEHGDHLPSKERTSFSKEQGEWMEGENFELLSIVPKSESKFVIEQLLMQETFSRAECSEMLKIIQSRVVEIPSADDGEEKHHLVPDSSFMGRRAWKSFDQNRNLSGMTNYFLSNLSSISSRFCNSEAITPELCNKAVLEAKKWLEDQKMTPFPKPDQECESCIWNINLKEYQGFGDDVSPVELAKLYVQSLPPWRSPSFSNNALKTHPQSLKHSSITGTNSLAQSMDMPRLKEEHLRKLPLQSQDTIELGGNTQIQEEANGLVEEIGTSQNVAEVDNIYSDLDTINDEDLIYANCSNGDAAISISEVTLRPPNDVSSDLPITQVTGSSNRKHQNGTKIKPVKEC